MHITSDNKIENIKTAKNILKELNISADFSGYSDTNGVSVYFSDATGNKIRVSDHSVGNRRMRDELLISFDERLLGLKGKISFKSSIAINKFKVSSFYN